jgi:hypothetical protein
MMLPQRWLSQDPLQIIPAWSYRKKCGLRASVTYARQEQMRMLHDQRLSVWKDANARPMFPPIKEALRSILKEVA